MIRLAIAFCVLPVVAFASAPEAPSFSQQSIAVAGIKARRMDPEMLKVVEEVWVRGFPADFRVVRGAELGKAGEAARSCETSTCVAEKLKPTPHELAVRAEVSRLGGTLYVDVALIDIARGKVEKRLERSCGAQEELLVKTLREATFELLGASDRPVAAAASTSTPTGATSSTAPNATAAAVQSPDVSVRTEMTYVKMENPKKKKAAYACVGGALVTSASTIGLLIAGNSYDPTLATVSAAGIGLGLTAFTVAGLVYVVTPSHINKPTYTKVTVTPVTDGKTTGVAVAGRF